jgi:hypothetical protein
MSARIAAAASHRARSGPLRIAGRASALRHAPSTERVHLTYSKDEVAEFSASLRGIPPEQR